MTYDPLMDDRRLLPVESEDSVECEVCTDECLAPEYDHEPYRCERHEAWEESSWEGHPCWSDGEHYYAHETLLQLDPEEEEEPLPKPSAPIDMQDLASRLLGFGPRTLGGAR